MKSLRLAALPLVLTLLPPGAEAQQPLPRLTPVAAPSALRILDFDAAALAWLDDTTLALIDSDEKQVVIAKRGGAVRRLGREGSGPGEFRFPALLLAGDGSLLVADIGLRRVSRFDGKLAFAGSVPTPGPALQLLGIRGGGLRLAWLDFASADGGPVIGDLDLATGRATRRFAVFERDSVLAVHTGGMPGPNPFIAVTGAEGGRVVAASPRTYRITAFDSTGRTLRHFGRRLEPVYRTDAEVDAVVARAGASVRRMAGAEGATADPTGALRRSLRAEPKPHFNLMATTSDARGRLWVATSRGGSRTEVDVFGADGTFLGSVTLAGRVAALAVRLPWVAALSERTSGEDEGLQGVDLYRVTGE